MKEIIDAHAPNVRKLRSIKYSLSNLRIIFPINFLHAQNKVSRKLSKAHQVLHH